MKETPEARARILDAAERLFAERGFDATPTSRIAQLATVPKGLLFYYFPTKSDLLCALVAERLDLGPIDASMLIEPGDPVRALLNLERKLSEIQADSPVLRVIIWREQRTHPEVRAKLREHRLQVQAVVERVLRESVLRPIAAGTLRTAAVAWVAILTLRPAPDHLGVGSGTGVGTDDAAPDLRALAELICAGMGASGLA